MAIVSFQLDPDAAELADQSVLARNATGGALAEGTLVYLSGWDEVNARHLIAAAQGSHTGRHAQFVLRAALADATDGRAYLSHRLVGVDTSGAAVGDPVYLSESVAGGWTLTVPRVVRQVVGRVAVVDAVSGAVEFLIAGVAEETPGFVRTNPGSGEHVINGIRRNAAGNLELDYDDVAE